MTEQQAFIVKLFLIAVPNTHTVEEAAKKIIDKVSEQLLIIFFS